MNKNMKIFLVVVVLLQFLFVADTFAQNELKEKLKLLENKDFSLVSEIENGSETNRLGEDIESCLDSLISFVVSQKGVSEATFDKNIKPYLDKKLTAYNMIPIDFSDDEEMIYESFIKTLKWESIMESVKLYEGFIVKNYKDPLPIKSILIVLLFVKNVCIYTGKKSEASINSIIKGKLNEEFQSYNNANWNVFALNPGAMVYWLTATWVWDYKEN
jgi:hypothetical protein